MKSRISGEPVVVAALVLIAAGAALLVAFGVNLTTLQISAIVHFAEAALALAFIVRNRVTPTEVTP
jgi:hypothetical protein